MKSKGLVKGVIERWLLDGYYYPRVFLHKDWYGFYTKKNYKSQRAAKAAAERFAKQLNLEIEWE